MRENMTIFLPTNSDGKIVDFKCPQCREDLLDGMGIYYRRTSSGSAFLHVEDDRDEELYEALEAELPIPDGLTFSVDYDNDGDVTKEFIRCVKCDEILVVITTDWN